MVKNMDDNYFLYYLVPFEILVDTDIGVIKVMRDMFREDPRFDFTRLLIGDGYMDDDTLKFLLSYRLNKNPLYLITDEHRMTKKDIDAKYTEILNKYYPQVLGLSDNTLIYRMFDASKIHDASPVKITVLCRNEMQIKHLHSLKFKCDTILINDDKDLASIDLNRYQYIYVKDLESLMDFGVIDSKTIYVANYRFNMKFAEDEETGVSISVLNPEFIIDIINDNIIKIVDIYPKPDDILL